MPHHEAVPCGESTLLDAAPAGPRTLLLDELWYHLLSTWRTLPEALEGAGLSSREVFDECAVRTLCRLCISDGPLAEEATAMLMREMGCGNTRGDFCRTADRERLLALFGRVPARQRFRDWANSMLLLFDHLADLGAILSCGGRRILLGPRTTQAWERTGVVPIQRRELREALLLFDVHVSDATAWPEMFSECPQEPIDYGAFIRRIVTQPWLEGGDNTNCAYGGGIYESNAPLLSPSDIAIRLIHAWGDLTNAFALRPRAERVVSRTGSTSALPPDRCSNFPEVALEAAEARAAAQAPHYPSQDQWSRALRGTKQCRLLSEADVRPEAARQVSLQREAIEQTRGSCATVWASVFPNLREWLCVARTTYFPLELIIVRYSISDMGFLGPGILAPTATVRQPMMGAQPFVAIVPLGAETPVLSGCGNNCDSTPVSARTAAIGPNLSAPLMPQTRTGALALRAPCQTNSGGTDGLWALQLFAADDGQNSLGCVGSPLPIRIVCRPPQVPGVPSLLSCTPTSVTLTWCMPVDDGGAPVQANVLSLWPERELREGAAPLRLCRGSDVWPPYEIAGLESGTAYVARILCEHDGGTSPWSEVSRPFETKIAAPGQLCQPQVEDIAPASLTVSWPASLIPVTSYEVTVLPGSMGSLARGDGAADEPWVIKVSPPPPPPESLPMEVPVVPEEPPLEFAAMVAAADDGQNPEVCREQGWTKVVVDGLIPNTEYSFCVRGINTSGVGPQSVPSDQVLMGAGVPNKPGAPVKVDVTQTTMTLCWSPPTNDGGSPVVRYFVRGVEEGGEHAGLEFYTRDSTTTLVARRLTGNTRYVFRAYALNEAGLSPSSPPSGPLATAPLPPGCPRDLAVAGVEETSLTLSWREPESDGGAPTTQYRLEVFLQAAPEEHFGICTASLGVTVTRLRGNSLYVIRICAENGVGASEFAYELVARTGPVVPGPPGLPRGLGEHLATAATLAWSPPPDSGGSEVLGYTLRGYAYSPDSETILDELCALHAVAPRGTVECLEPSRCYRFRVQARTQAGTGPFSDWSPVIRTAPPPPPVPSTPEVISVTSQTIVVAWQNGNDGLDTPEIEYEVAAWRVSKAGNSVDSCPRVSRVMGPPVRFKGLRTFCAYSFQVRALGRGGWSSWSEASDARETTDEWTKEEIFDFLMQKYGLTLAGVFRAFDRDCDGFVSVEDFMKGLDHAGLQMVSPEQRAELFAEADEAERGFVTLREFVKCFMRASSPTERLQTLQPSYARWRKRSVSPTRHEAPARDRSCSPQAWQMSLRGHRAATRGRHTSPKAARSTGGVATDASIAANPQRAYSPSPPRLPNGPPARRLIRRGSVPAQSSASCPQVHALRRTDTLPTPLRQVQQRCEMMQTSLDSECDPLPLGEPLLQLQRKGCIDGGGGGGPSSLSPLAGKGQRTSGLDRGGGGSGSLSPPAGPRPAGRCSGSLSRRPCVGRSSLPGGPQPGRSHRLVLPR